MYQLVIIGGGPGGVAAGVYAARKQIRFLLITDEIGGQSVVSSSVCNWIGEQKISGFEFAEKLEKHLKAQVGLELVEREKVVKVTKVREGYYKIRLGTGAVYEAERVLIVTGSLRRHLGVPGSDEFTGKGVAYCSTCDAPIFKDKVVAVVGGGNAGIGAVTDLLPYTSKIFLMERGNRLRGDAVDVRHIEEVSKVEILYNTSIKEIYGNDFVAGLKYENLKNGEVKDLPLQGVFVEVGAYPNSEIVKHLVKLNKKGEIVVDHKTQRTSDAGIWAAGDVSDSLYKQNNTSAGDAIKAVLNIYDDILRPSGS